MRCQKFFYHVCIMIRTLLSAVLLLVMTSAVFSQAEQDILLMTGKVIRGTVTGNDSVNLFYDFYKKNGKTKARTLEMERVFSVISDGGDERIIYYMDTAVGNYFTVDEMRYYIQGEQDAMQYYHANWTIAAGLPITSGLGYVLSGTIFAFAVPFVYLVGSGMPKYKIDKNKISSAHLVSEPAYVLGYERTARNKRLFKALFTGLAGTAIGFTIGQTINQP